MTSPLTTALAIAIHACIETMFVYLPALTMY